MRLLILLLVTNLLCGTQMLWAEHPLQWFLQPPRSPKQIAELRAKAEKGDAEAQTNLGAMYARGQGVAKNLAECVKWLRKAADQGYAKGQIMLGMVYLEPETAFHSPADGVKWLRKAADQGDVNGQLGLAELYGDGQGVPKDGIEAYKWYLLAAAQGDESAKAIIAMSSDQMKPAEVAEGERRAREFKPVKAPAAARQGTLK